MLVRALASAPGLCIAYSVMDGDNRRRRCADGGYVPGLWDAAAGCL